MNAESVSEEVPVTSTSGRAGFTEGPSDAWHVSQLPAPWTGPVIRAAASPGPLTVRPASPADLPCQQRSLKPHVNNAQP